jgi:hypothetical protein
VQVGSGDGTSAVDRGQGGQALRSCRFPAGRLLHRTLLELRRHARRQPWTCMRNMPYEEAEGNFRSTIGQQHTSMPSRDSGDTAAFGALRTTRLSGSLSPVISGLLRCRPICNMSQRAKDANKRREDSLHGTPLRTGSWKMEVFATWCRVRAASTAAQAGHVSGKLPHRARGTQWFKRNLGRLS